MIYLDSSALLKLVLREPESDALQSWFSARSGIPIVSSELAKVEVLRGCRRVNPAALPTARSLINGIDLVPLSSTVLEEAAELPGDGLRSLDAIHLASALALREDLTAFVVYDRRLAQAATDAGVSPVAPAS